MTFPKGALLENPSRLFNADLKGGAWRAIDFHKDDKVDAKALKALIRSAVALNAWHKTNRSKTRKPRAYDAGSRGQTSSETAASSTVAWPRGFRFGGWNARGRGLSATGAGRTGSA